jgi:Holliday junction resolvasome RuvABC endonuclease subunit
MNLIAIDPGNTESVIIGIDPGQSGGIAFLEPQHGPFGVVAATKMPDTEADVRDLFGQGNKAFAFIESVHSMPKQGVSSSFKFGRNYGFLRGVLIALGIPFEEVTPQKWQKAMGCMSRGDKNVTKARAQQLFPSVPRITHATADALLIAEFGRRKRNGTL